MLLLQGYSEEGIILDKMCNCKKIEVRSYNQINVGSSYIHCAPSMNIQHNSSALLHHRNASARQCESHVMHQRRSVPYMQCTVAELCGRQDVLEPNLVGAKDGWALNWGNAENVGSKMSWNRNELALKWAGAKVS